MSLTVNNVLIRVESQSSTLWLCTCDQKESRTSLEDDQNTSSFGPHCFRGNTERMSSGRSTRMMDRREDGMTFLSKSVFGPSKVESLCDAHALEKNKVLVYCSFGGSDLALHSRRHTFCQIDLFETRTSHHEIQNWWSVDVFRDQARDCSEAAVGAKTCRRMRDKNKKGRNELASEVRKRQVVEDYVRLENEAECFSSSEENEPLVGIKAN
ncbi:hypothetical protein CROQUDRAFT_85575 [Cronartium quercuum f. sp. fusiforme G11]|uniref:Uncharacterized protein n=1 Tax=Cronartium quercuum f. sp. fusiforme G11 TaxID=708437 RepID=A0A9P6NV22_9BASI|nr:hypothetical protein CROQUDRAFT_85575 [Cronartium quercuum f. sp. fusiforme G11]